MFFHSDHKKKGLGITGIFRMILSVLMMAIVGIAFFQAYKAFSGYDPLTVSPKSVLSNFLSPDSAFEFINGLLTVSPGESLDKAKEILEKGTDQTVSNTQPSTSGTLQYKFAIITDSHKDTQNLARALSMARDQGAKFIVGLGDFSDVGTVEELTESKKVFDASGQTYYVTAGDHDLWDSRDKGKDPTQNFIEVFGSFPYQSFSFEDTRFMIIYNSDNYSGLDEAQVSWIEEELKKEETQNSKLTFVFAGIPLFHPSSDHQMGKTTPKLKNQADHLMSIFKRHGVNEVFAGDTHFYSRYKEPKNELQMTSVGAVTSVRNPQASRFVMVDVFTEGGYNVTDVEIR